MSNLKKSTLENSHSKLFWSSKLNPIEIGKFDFSELKLLVFYLEILIICFNFWTFILVWDLENAIVSQLFHILVDTFLWLKVKLFYERVI